MWIAPGPDLELPRRIWSFHDTAARILADET
jgi:hypothetical protein